MAKRIGARVDVDDREESVSKRIREAEKEWVPYIIVVGERETDGNLTVRTRDDEVQMSLEQLNREIDERMGDMPRIPLLMPVLVSKRPVF